MCDEAQWSTAPDSHTAVRMLLHPAPPLPLHSAFSSILILVQVVQINVRGPRQRHALVLSDRELVPVVHDGGFLQEAHELGIAARAMQAGRQAHANNQVRGRHPPSEVTW